MFLVYGAHKRSGRGQYFIHKDEDGLFRGQLDPLADYVDELAYGEILRPYQRQATFEKFGMY